MSKVNVSDVEILERFARVVARSLRIEEAQVIEEAYLDDLGAESLDLLEITMEAEDEFNILIPQKNILQTAQEVFGAGVLVTDGRVTAEGRKFLLRRMPEAECILAGEDLTVAELNRMFLRVGTWVRMIRGLLEHSPRHCPECGGAFGKAVAGRVKCPQCATERDLPSGDDLNRQWVQEYHRTQYLSSSANPV